MMRNWGPHLLMAQTMSWIFRLCIGVFGIAIKFILAGVADTKHQRQWISDQTKFFLSKNFSDCKVAFENSELTHRNRSLCEPDKIFDFLKFQGDLPYHHLRRVKISPTLKWPYPISFFDLLFSVANANGSHDYFASTQACHAYATGFVNIKMVL